MLYLKARLVVFIGLLFYFKSRLVVYFGVTMIIFNANVSSFSLAESPPRDLQITAYK